MLVPKKTLKKQLVVWLPPGWFMKQYETMHLLSTTSSSLPGKARRAVDQSAWSRSQPRSLRAPEDVMC